MYPKRSFQPQPVPARFAWFATLVAGLCQFPLSSPLRESISQAWIDKLSGGIYGIRTHNLHTASVSLSPIGAKTP